MKIENWLETKIASLKRKIDTPGYAPPDSEYHLFFALRGCLERFNKKSTVLLDDYFSAALKRWRSEIQRGITADNQGQSLTDIEAIDWLLKEYCPAPKPKEFGVANGNS